MRVNYPVFEVTTSSSLYATKPSWGSLYVQCFETPSEQLGPPFLFRMYQGRNKRLIKRKWPRDAITLVENFEKKGVFKCGAFPHRVLYYMEGRYYAAVQQATFCLEHYEKKTYSPRRIRGLAWEENSTGNTLAFRPTQCSDQQNDLLLKRKCNSFVFRDSKSNSPLLINAYSNGNFKKMLRSVYK